MNIHDPKNPEKGCTTRHPPLIFDIGDTTGTIYGSSCTQPIAEADLYISLDPYAPVFAWEQPWLHRVEGSEEHLEHQHKEHIRFPIKDFSVPQDSSQFNACLDYAIEAMSQGKVVHVGCISGHGRTGMFLSALTQKLIPEHLIENDISAIDYVRDNYCAKVVETVEQVLFLYANFDVAIPVREKEDIAYIKKEFKKELGVSLDEIIASGEFNACSDIIEDLEAELLQKKFSKMKGGKFKGVTPPYSDKDHYLDYSSGASFYEESALDKKYWTTRRKI